MKKLYIILYLMPAFAFAQSTEQNFIQTTVYKDSVANSPAVKAITYFDGLGRPVQQRQHAQSNTGKDIVTHIAYDGQGRQAKDFLPFSSGSATLNFSDAVTTETSQLQFYSSGGAQQTGNPNFEITSFPFSEKSFEPSPLQRVIRQSAPGEAWKLDAQGGADHSIKFGYSINTSADQVKIFNAVAGTAVNANGCYDVALTRPIPRFSTYTDGALFKNTVKNENWEAGQANPLANTTEEYKDKLGRVVLKRTYGESIVDGAAVFGRHDTYYVYDQYGNLSFVIPPLSDGSDAQLDKLCYQYRYDGRNRLVEKKLPGKRLWDFIVYDKQGNVAATGPALSPFPGDSRKGWLMSKYDAMGRVLYTLWYYGREAMTSNDRKELQQSVNNGNRKVEKLQSSTSIDHISAGYSNEVFPVENFNLLTIHYYDSNGLVNRAHPGSILGQNVMGFNKGLPTGTWTRILTSAQEYEGLNTAWYYDYKGRVISTYSQNALGGYTTVDSKQDFSGKVLYTVTTHKKTEDGPDLPIAVRENFTYSAQDRLLTHTHEINSNGAVHLMASHEYDELGQLISKSVGGLLGAGALQKVNYSYNIRGWLKGINNTQNLVQSGDPKDLFAFRLSYDQISGTPAGAKNLYNGNISETYWRTAGDDVLRKYAYRYDDMDRLREAVYHRDGQVRDSYNENMTYDKNGNLREMNRNGVLDAQGQVIEIDRLEYGYKADSPNQLATVLDHSNHPLGFRDDSTDGLSDPNGDDYSYDDFGNLTADQNKKITGIDYNHLNLPAEIRFAVGKINYLYDASGRKLRKMVTSGNGTVSVTDYAGGYQYLNGVLLFFPTAEGYVNSSLVNGANVFHYAYNYTDHLGNIRLTYGVDPVTGVLKIMEENHYYPYGMKHGNYNSGGNAFQKVNLDISLKAAAAPSDPGNGGDLSVSPFKYKYNGKEYQDELGLNMYDMDMRQYDPAIGRWTALDPVVHHDMSPYNAFDNNPVFWADPSGADSQSGLTDSNGNNRFDPFGLFINPMDRNNSGNPFDDVNREREGGSSYKKLDGDKDTDPPKTIKDWFLSLFAWSEDSPEEADSNNEVRKTFYREGEKTIEMGKVYHSTILTIMTLPFGGEGGAFLESKGAITVVKESATKYSIIAESGSASSFYKILNPNWNGAYQYTKGAFSTTSFTTASGIKVVLNTTSMSTGQASVKIIEKGMQILLRFPKI